MFSPRTRGCSGATGGVWKLTVVFPAHAGMFRRAPCRFICPSRFPRARGDVPSSNPVCRPTNSFSPRTRGCSAPKIAAALKDYVFPAHAGMFRRSLPNASQSKCFPRARGDVPRLYVGAKRCWLFSPRTRGCSLTQPMTEEMPEVFPAHAGMFRSSPAGLPYDMRFPRARGDVPFSPGVVEVIRGFSPRTRGCSWNTTTPITQTFVFPAHAGMFPHDDRNRV